MGKYDLSIVIDKKVASSFINGVLLMVGTSKRKATRPVLKAYGLLRMENEVFIECFKTSMKHEVV